MKSCLNCLYHGPPVSTKVPEARPCLTCIQGHKDKCWVLTDIKEYEAGTSERKT